MTTFTVEKIEAQDAAVVRAEVPLQDVPAVFDRAFHEVMRVVAAQDVIVTGPPVRFLSEDAH